MTLTIISYDRREPEFADSPGYGIYPCDNKWHITKKPYPGPTGHCPNCPNTWWAVDGTECPVEYALRAEIVHLRALLVVVT